MDAGTIDFMPTEPVRWSVVSFTKAAIKLHTLLLELGRCTRFYISGDDQKLQPER
jgi:hypothetical protein